MEKSLNVASDNLFIDLLVKRFSKTFDEMQQKVEEEEKLYEPTIVAIYKGINRITSASICLPPDMIYDEILKLNANYEVCIEKLNFGGYGSVVKVYV
ncbi:MAG: hypothetical protein RSE41_03100 [Clostridia bacterium]